MGGAQIFLVALLSTAVSVQGLQFAPRSNCQALCSDGTGADAAKTNTSDVVCEDDDFADSGKGIKFKNCISCLQDSDFVSDSGSDVHAFLYNLRYAFDVCLYSYPDDPVGGLANTPCILDGACQQLDDSLKTSLLDPNSSNAYDYCDKTNDFNKGSSYKGCVDCLKSTKNQRYFANFLVALKAGCEQKPKEGDLISLSGDVFSTSLVNITQPEEDITSRPQGAGSNTLTTGAIVGIAVGCALLFIGAGVLIFIHCRRQRRNAREKIDSPPPETPGRPKFIGSSLPTKQKMSESISSFKNHPDMSHKRAYSTNATYYDSLRPELGGQGLGLSYPYNPQSKSNGSFGIMPSHPAYDPRVMSRNSERSRSPPKHPLGKLTDSYALRTYLNAPEPTNPANPSDPGRRIAGHHGRSFSQPMRQPPRPPATAMVGIPPPPPPKQHRPKVPSLVLPSLSKAKRSKTYEPPQVITTDQEEAPYVTTSQDH